jgi:hypothetical protein
VLLSQAAWLVSGDFGKSRAGTEPAVAVGDHGLVVDDRLLRLNNSRAEGAPLSALVEQKKARPEHRPFGGRLGASPPAEAVLIRTGAAPFGEVLYRESRPQMHRAHERVHRAEVAREVGENVDRLIADSEQPRLGVARVRGQNRRRRDEGKQRLSEAGGAP